MTLMGSWFLAFAFYTFLCNLFFIKGKIEFTCIKKTFSFSISDSWLTVLLLSLLQKTEQATLTMAEDDEAFASETALYCSNSSEESLCSNSDSGSDTEVEEEADLETQKNKLTIISAQHLSLVDDDVPLLVPHHEEMFGEIDGKEN